MSINKSLTNLITFGMTAMLFLFLPATVRAASIVHINSLPSYETTNNFKISCTTDGTNAQFSYQKGGGSWTNFGSVINVATNPEGCITQVDSSIINEQTSYNFRVSVDGLDSSNTTSTTYDTSGPSPVTNFSKNRISDSQYRIYWTTPGDSDFDKVIIYHGDTPDFSADGSHQIAVITGSPNLSQNYDDNFAPNPSLTYYYYVRAIDHAGNSSSLVGDAGIVSSSTIQTSVITLPTTGKVTILPKEFGEGSILGVEADLSPEPSSTPTSIPTITATDSDSGAIRWIATHKKISLSVAALLFILGYSIYHFTYRGRR